MKVLTIANKNILKVIHSVCICRKGVAMTVTCHSKSSVCGSYTMCQAEATPIRFTVIKKL